MNQFIPEDLSERTKILFATDPNKIANPDSLETTVVKEENTNHLIKNTSHLIVTIIKSHITIFMNPKLNYHLNNKIIRVQLEMIS